MDKIFDIWQTFAREQRDAFRKAVPHARVVAVDGASHYVFISQSGTVLEEMRKFLRDLCGRVRSHLYVENPIADELEEMPPDPEGELLFPAWFLTAGLATDARLICSTVATNGKLRRLYRLDLR